MCAASFIEIVPPSAAELILDLLMGEPGQALPVQALARGAEVLGIAVPSMRVALTRLLKQGRIQKAGRGYYSIRVTGNPVYHQVTNWFRRERQVHAWRHQWLMVHDAPVPRSQRTLWQRHTKALELQGFRLLRDDLWVRPDNLEGGLDGMRAVLHSFGLAPSSIIFAAHQFDPSTAERVLELWDIAQLNAFYPRARVLLEKSSVKLERMRLESAARESLLLGRSVIRAIVHDPLLPDEILSADGRRALVKGMAAYQKQARQIWQRVLDI